jgi:hypothetical protein
MADKDYDPKHAKPSEDRTPTEEIPKVPAEDKK